MAVCRSCLLGFCFSSRSLSKARDSRISANGLAGGGSNGVGLTPAFDMSSSCKLAELRHLAVAEHDGFDHLVFGDFLTESLDHQHRLFAAGDDQIEGARFEFFLGRKDDEPSVDHADPHRGDRVIEWDRRDA